MKQYLYCTIGIVAALLLINVHGATRHSGAGIERVMVRDHLKEDVNSKRALEWTNWVRTPIDVDGNATDWIGNYTPHAIGRPGKNVDLYMASNETYLYICIDARCDTTDTFSVSDKIILLIDGDNDNAVVPPIGSATNESTQDNWITICGNTSARSNTSGINNDAGWLNTDGGTSVSQWFDAYNPYLQNRFINYLYAVGFNGTPGNMVYEIGIPFLQWNWTPGDDLGACLVLFEDGEDTAIGIWPMGFNRNDMSTWQDFFLATPNDRPVYSNQQSFPSIVPNDNHNSTLFTVEATDPDGNISEIIIDLSPIGGGSSVRMVDDGSNGDATPNDDTYSIETTIPTIIGPGLYNLTFFIEDDHTPNIGRAYGTITLTVIQANRQPEISFGAIDRMTLTEDQMPVYINLTSTFDDPDEDDVLTYSVLNKTSWEPHHLSELAEYRVLLNNTLKIRPLDDKYGSESIRIKAVDSGGLPVNTPHQITINILPVNDRPRIISVNDIEILDNNVSLTANEDQWSTFVFNDMDIDEDPLQYSINISEDLSDLRKNTDYFFYPSNGTFKIKPLNHHVGEYNLQVVADDENGGVDSVEVNLTIVNTNDPPRLNRIKSQYVEQGQWLIITPEASDDDEIWGDRLTFFTNFSEHFHGMLNGSNFYFNSSSGEFRFKPDYNMVSEFYTYIKVRDMAFNGSRADFKIVVENVNDPPSTPYFDHTSCDKNLTVIFTAPPCYDPDFDILTYMWDFGDDSHNLYGENKLMVQHKYKRTGNYTVTLYVSDGGLNSTRSYEKTITIIPPDDNNVLPNGSVTGRLELSGKIIGNAGGIENAVIRIEDINEPTNNNVTRSDPEGNFSFQLKRGDYRLIISAEGFLEKSIERSLTDRDQYLEIKMTSLELDDKGEEKQASRPVNEMWLWILLTLIILLTIFGVVMLLLIKRRKEKVDEVLQSDEVSILPPEGQVPQPLITPEESASSGMEYVYSTPMEDYHEQMESEEEMYFELPKLTESAYPSEEGSIYEAEEILPNGKMPKETEVQQLETSSTLKDGDEAKEKSAGIFTPKTLGSRDIPSEAPIRTKRAKSIEDTTDTTDTMDTTPDELSETLEAEGESMSCQGKATDSPLDTSDLSLIESSPRETEGESKRIQIEEKTPGEAIHTPDLSPKTAGIDTSEGPRLQGGMDEASSETLVDEEGKKSLQSILQGIVERDNWQEKYDIKPKPPEPPESEAEREDGQKNILSVFEGLFDNDDEKEEQITRDENVLGQLPVKRVAISKEDGSRLRICEICSRPRPRSQISCPYCSGEQIIVLRCPSCMNEIEKTMVFCNKCGLNLKNQKAVKGEKE